MEGRYCCQERRDVWVDVRGRPRGRCVPVRKIIYVGPGVADHPRAEPRLRSPRPERPGPRTPGTARTAAGGGARLKSHGQNSRVQERRSDIIGGVELEKGGHPRRERGRSTPRQSDRARGERKRGDSGYGAAASAARGPDTEEPRPRQCQQKPDFVGKGSKRTNQRARFEYFSRARPLYKEPRILSSAYHQATVTKDSKQRPAPRGEVSSPASPKHRGAQGRLHGHLKRPSVRNCPSVTKKSTTTPGERPKCKFQGLGTDFITDLV